MWVTIAGFDQTANIPPDGAGQNGSAQQFKQTSNDPAPTFNFDVQDDGSLLNFSIGDEVIAWDENAPAYPSLAGHLILTPPAMNLVQLPDNGGTDFGQWALVQFLSSLISPFPSLFPNMTFANTAVIGPDSTGFATSITPPGYIHAGQQYMFSIYATIAVPLVNATAVVKMRFLDGEEAGIGATTSISFATTMSSTGNPNAQQRIAISATAPAGATYLQLWFGGQILVSGTNSGTINYGTPQVEPMYFQGGNRSSRHYPLSYPTPDCNAFQSDCALMPDNTTSRMVRLFAGIINDIKKDYIGNNRVWHIQCAGPGVLLEDGHINATFTNFTDAQIIESVVFTYFAGKIAIGVPNAVLPFPVTTGVTISSIVYSDNSLKDLLNGLISQSNYIYYVDMYYRLYYQPQISATATFTLSDSPDNVNSFPYYEYSIDEDGTQLERNIKVLGGNFSGTKQDIFSGNSSTKQFTLTYIPDKITTLLVGSTAQRVGVYGRDTFAGPFDVLLNTQLQYILFNVAPPTVTNNVACTYAYQAPISTIVTLSAGNVTAPAYAQPSYDAVVNDSNIADLATATERGLAEIVQRGSPLIIIDCKAQQYAPAGFCIVFTSVKDGILNQPFVVQSVQGQMIGVDETMEPYNEFTYQLGDYQPTLTEHIKNSNKALNRSSTVANVTTAQQFDFVAMEAIGYRDSVTAVPQPTFAVGIYGNAGSKYGACSYGGQTGKYGSTAQYGRSTIYG